VKVVFSLEEPAKARLLLVDLAGGIISNLSLGEQAAGEQSLDLDLAGINPGVYQLVLMADSGFGPKPKAIFKLAVSY
jgi:hypothetical protein